MGVLLTSISLSSRPTWSHTHVFTYHWPPTLQLSLLRRPTMNNFLLPKSPTLASSQLTRWSSVILVTENTWLAACCTVVMLSPRMSTLPLQPSRPREPSSSSTGAQLVSRSESTTSHQPLSQVVILPRCNVPSAC